MCALILVNFILASFPAQAQEPDPIVIWQTLINEARLDKGLDPFDFSTLLTISAQRHADDMVANQVSSYVGADGSMPRQRIAEAGYAAWTQDNGELIAGENFWIGDGTIEDAMAFFLEDPPQRANVLSTTYREIGIGAATGADGHNYHVLDFGVRPNVLPIFINDGATNADVPQVAIRLSNEEARPDGEGMIFMGKAIEIRVNNEPNFENLPWQSWEKLIPWTFPDAPGQYTVYVQFRDAAGRTAASADTIVLGEGVISAPTAIPPIPTQEPSATPIPVAPPSESVTMPVPAAPEPPPTPEPSPTPYVVNSVPAAQDNVPFPTWTPLPIPTPEEDSAPSSLPPWLASLQKIALPLLVVMQGVVILMGIYLVLRRGSSQT
ncbi:MAG: CAP domain-containing protein [Chloroflexi bacterium]|nr:CAP domain-containing protein [Chloroflexota bacterium]